jgi:peptidoglycan/LPS O-acetylase OafA/YrhL
LKAVTGIRFVAAFYVVVFHTGLARHLMDHGHMAAGNFLANGFLAVPLFFLLSGFILAYTYADQIDERGGDRRFWEARFARIWPVYALSIVMASIPHPNFSSGADVVASIFMVQAWNPWRPGMAGAGNLVCWTLSAEALFYLCFPWAQRWIERRGTAAVLCWTGLMLLVCVALNTSSRTLSYPAQGVFRWIPLAPLHVSEFLAGVGLGNYFLRRMRDVAPTGRNVVAGSGALTYVSAALAVGLLCRAGDRWTSVVDVAFCGLILGLAGERTGLSRFLSTPTMVLGGGISYSVYLIQMPVKSWVYLATTRLHVHSEVIRLSLTAVALLVISWVLFRTVEDPCRRVLRDFFLRLETTRLARERQNSMPGD